MKDLKVMIVEDEILIAHNISLYLSEFGYNTVAVCISYDEAITAYHLHSPDIVLLDIRLFGDRSGIDIAHYLSGLDGKPPYIFLTSQIDKRLLDAAIQTMPYGYITKPFSKEALYTGIKIAMELYKSQHNKEEVMEIYDGKQTHLILLDSIVYLKSDHIYTSIILESDKKLITRVKFEESIDTDKFDHFLRCHRSYIINTKFVTSYNRTEVFLLNTIQIPISKSRRDFCTDYFEKKLAAKQ